MTRNTLCHHYPDCLSATVRLDFRDSIAVVAGIPRMTLPLIHMNLMEFLFARRGIQPGARPFTAGAHQGERQMTELLTQKDFSKLIQVSEMTIRRYLRSGKIRKGSLVPHGKRFLIDPEKAVADLKRTLEPTKQRAVFPDAVAPSLVDDEDSGPDTTPQTDFDDAVTIIAGCAMGLPPETKAEICLHLGALAAALNITWPPGE